MHHLNDELLLSYAAGSLDEAQSLLVASHLTLCPECRRRLASLEAAGGALFEALDGEDVSEDALDAVLDRLDEPEPPRSAPDRTKTVTGVLPAPLRKYVGGDIGDIRWRAKGPGVGMAELPVRVEGQRAFMLRVDPGRAVPQHTHEGAELVMVLTGGYTDEYGHFLRGDVEIADPSVDHRPVADPGEPCVILAVTDAPIRFTGAFGRLLNYFVRL